MIATSLSFWLHRDDCRHVTQAQLFITIMNEIPALTVYFFGLGLFRCAGPWHNYNFDGISCNLMQMVEG